jgi:hypothetical protein
MMYRNYVIFSETESVACSKNTMYSLKKETGINLFYIIHYAYVEKANLGTLSNSTVFFLLHQMRGSQMLNVGMSMCFMY